MRDDSDIREFIAACPRQMTHSELEVAIQARFGADRAWSRSRIVAFCLEATTEKISRSPIILDRELCAFIDDRLFRFTLDEIVLECRDLFGRARAPSRSAIHRYATAVRRNLEEQGNL